ncbi:PGF-CTERM-anchored ABC transporter substrate-binding protein [Halococcoides cellulosivorans]|uniref:ABC transporter substrate-binding protein n=1 Tax=Halococcoides cellulosivorans TaxID=1679096 RepID=A0A2R4X140_9EURY|nr:PGF-CTERM-anchored ABC transporter substrate-binding protein [Halococcoides cellulosivorans]AWB27514.1 ABC transporter substrate-binding protein [Halococcoides cellulosivorans]
MRTRTPIVIVAVLLIAVAAVPPLGVADTAAECEFPHERTDATGTTVTVEESPDRIVVLAPSAAQTVWALGAQDRVVGMPREYHATYLNGTDGVTNVVTETGQPKIETVVAQEPDLVLAPNVTDPETVETLRSSGLTVYHFRQVGSLAGVSEKTRTTGRLIGACEAAATVSSDTETRVSDVREGTADRDRPLVYYAMGGGWTAGPDTFIGDVIATAGGENVAARANISEYGQISAEVLAREDPDWIVAPEGTDIDSTALANTTAVRDEQIVRVNRDYLHQAGPRVTNPLERIARHLHGASASFTTNGTANASITVNGTETTTGDSDAAMATTTTQTPAAPTDAGGPGFGPAAGAIALVAGAGLVRRRR